MDHFYTQQKGRRPSIIKDQKKKKTQLKPAWKKKAERQMERECKKKKEWNFRPE